MAFTKIQRNVEHFMKKKKIGFLGGTFDPLHFGHLNVAITCLESHNLDHVFFCPAGISPFKDTSSLISADHRLAMLLLGIQEIKQFSGLDWEITRPGPSYTGLDGRMRPSRARSASTPVPA